MQITAYPKVTEIDKDDVMLTDGTNGTKIISASDLAINLVNIVALGEISNNTGEAIFDILDKVLKPEQRRATFRGKNIGTSLTTEQRTNIQNGTFKGLFLGDYWSINGIIWRIVDFNYWYNCGDSAFTNNHLVIMPDVPLYNAQMNTTNTTVGGYINSLMYTTNLETAKTTVNSAFGSAVLMHRELLTNAVTNGYPSGGSWYDSTVELPNEIMMYGSYVHTPAGDGTIIPYRYTINRQQLALFQLYPKFVANRTNQWLRDVCSSSLFAFVGGSGGAYCHSASNSLGVRPVFAIG